VKISEKISPTGAGTMTPHPNPPHEPSAEHTRENGPLTPALSPSEGAREKTRPVEAHGPCRSLEPAYVGCYGGEKVYHLFTDLTDFFRASNYFFGFDWVRLGSNPACGETQKAKSRKQKWERARACECKTVKYWSFLGF